MPSASPGRPIDRTCWVNISSCVFTAAAGDYLTDQFEILFGHFFTFSPSSKSWRTADDRVAPFFAAQASTAPMISADALTVKSGSLPVAGRPGRFCCTFIDFFIVYVVP
jgi:hypothetical protein